MQYEHLMLPISLSLRPIHKGKKETHPYTRPTPVPSYAFPYPAHKRHRWILSALANASLIQFRELVATLDLVSGLGISLAESSFSHAMTDDGGSANSSGR